MKKKKWLLALLVVIALFTVLTPTVYASSGGAGGVSTAIENTWKDARTQIKTICNNVVFPAVDLILAILFFVKLATSYFEYKKHGSFEFTGPAILFFGLIFMLTCPLYIWTILGM